MINPILFSSTKNVSSKKQVQFGVVDPFRTGEDGAAGPPINYDEINFTKPCPLMKRLKNFCASVKKYLPW